MPGYRALSDTFTGSAADTAREAESLRREGEPETAVVLLEEALLASRRTTPELPGWLCGRLAALYRTLGRYDDEVVLLERYRESQTCEEARSRYDARLSKARTIAERKRRSDSGALLSVRKVLRTPRRRSAPATSSAIATISPAHEFRDTCVDLLSAQLGERTSDDYESRVDLVLTTYCAAARSTGTPVERLVEGLKEASSRADTTQVTDAERGARYSGALLRLLAIYFEDHR